MYEICNLSMNPSEDFTQRHKGTKITKEDEEGKREGVVSKLDLIPSR